MKFCLVHSYYNFRFNFFKISDQLVNFIDVSSKCRWSLVTTNHILYNLVVVVGNKHAISSFI